MSRRCPKSNAVVYVPASAFISKKVHCPTCGRETVISPVDGRPDSRGHLLARLAGHNRASATMPAVVAVEICYTVSDSYDAHDVAMRVRDAIHSAIAMADEGSSWKDVRTVEVGVGETAFRYVPPNLDSKIRLIEENVLRGAILRRRRGL